MVYFAFSFLPLATPALAKYLSNSSSNLGSKLPFLSPIHNFSHFSPLPGSFLL